MIWVAASCALPIKGISKCIYLKRKLPFGVSCNSFLGHTIEFDNLFTRRPLEQQDVTAEIVQNSRERDKPQHGGLSTLLVCGKYYIIFRSYSVVC